MNDSNMISEYIEGDQAELDNAMGVYPFGRNSKQKLYGFMFCEQTKCERLGATVLVFHDKYRRLKIDLFFFKDGELRITDYYGDTMNRADMFHVKINRK